MCARLLTVERWKKIIAEYDAGGTTLNKLARKYELTERAISKILKKPV